MARHPSLLVIALTVFTAACGKSGGGSDDALATYPAPQTVGTGAVVAEVGPVVFTTGEFERRLEQQSPFFRAQLQDPAQLAVWVRNEIRIEAIAQRAWEEGLHRDPVVLDKIRKVLVEAYTRKEMETAGTSVEPSPVELHDAYKARESEFNVPAKIRLSQIVRYVDSERQRKKARALLDKIQTDVIEGQKKNDHTVFAKAVRAHSQDEATKLGAGDLQFQTRAQLTDLYGQAVADVSFDDATVGDLYVANAPNAVVLFKKTGVRRAIERSLEEVRGQLRSQLIQEKKRARIESWSKELLARSGVSIDPDALAKIRIPGEETAAEGDP